MIKSKSTTIVNGIKTTRFSLLDASEKQEGFVDLHHQTPLHRGYSNAATALDEVETIDSMDTAANDSIELAHDDQQDEQSREMSKQIVTVALTLNEYLMQPNEQATLTKVGDGGVTISSYNRYTQKRDIIRAVGITTPLKRIYYGDENTSEQVYFSKRSPQAGIPSSMSPVDRKKESIKNKKKGRSKEVERQLALDWASDDGSDGIKVVASIDEDIFNTATASPSVPSSYPATMQQAKDRGDLFHSKMETLSDLLILKRRKDIFHVLKMTELREAFKLKNLPKGVTADISETLRLYRRLDYEFHPVAAELPVCQFSKIDEVFKKKAQLKESKASAANSSESSPSFVYSLFNSLYQLAGDRIGKGRSSGSESKSNKTPASSSANVFLYGTKIDAVVYWPEKHALACIEFKTTTGDGLMSKSKMAGEFRDRDNSIMEQAKIQVTLGIEYLKDTYEAALIRATRTLGIAREIYGVVIIVDTVKCGPVQHVIVSPSEQAVIIEKLKREGFV